MNWMMIVFVLVLILIFFLGVMVIDHNRFVVRRYRVESRRLRLGDECIEGGSAHDSDFQKNSRTSSESGNLTEAHTKKTLKAVFVSDLHDQVYAKDNAPIYDVVRKEQPDVILIGGDLIVAKSSYRKAMKGDSHWMDKSLRFLDELRDIAPIYYVNGNHESQMEEDEDGNETDFYLDYQERIGKIGVHVLHNDSETLPGTNMKVYGYEHHVEHYEKLFSNPIDADDPETKLGKPDETHFNLLLAHNPKFFPFYARWGADLVLSGHVHGGLMRLGKLGFIAPDLHLFPKYSGGEYFLEKMTGKELQKANNEGTLEESVSEMILSCGLGAHTLPIRIFNPGEISVIEFTEIRI